MSKNNTSSSQSSRRRQSRRSWQQSNQAASIIICTIVYIYIIINNTSSTTYAFSSSSNNPPPPQPPPPFTNPQTPEEVVQNQLHYYQTSNLSAVYELNSPENKEATGSISNLQSSLTKPPYNVLLNFERADVLLEVLPDAFMEDDDESNDTSLCLVCIRPNRMLEKCNSVWFWWELSRHKMIEEGNDNDNDDAENSNNSNDEMQWMVDCVIPDFEDLDFETDSLSIEEFGGEEGEGGDDDDLTIYWDVGGL